MPEPRTVVYVGTTHKGSNRFPCVADYRQEGHRTTRYERPCQCGSGRPVSKCGAERDECG